MLNKLKITKQPKPEGRLFYYELLKETCDQPQHREELNMTWQAMDDSQNCFPVKKFFRATLGHMEVPRLGVNRSYIWQPRPQP